MFRKLIQFKKSVITLWTLAIIIMNVLIAYTQVSQLEEFTRFTASQIAENEIIRPNERDYNGKSSIKVFFASEGQLDEWEQNALSYLKYHPKAVEKSELIFNSGEKNVRLVRRIHCSECNEGKFLSVTVDVSGIYQRTLQYLGFFGGCNIILWLFGLSVIKKQHMVREREKSIISHMAYHDALTDLPNRRAMYEELKIAVADDEPFAVILIDLDGFKGINDTLGHNYGDMVLKEISGRLTTVVRSTDVVSRIGGDEFVVVIKGLYSQDKIAEIAKTINRISRDPFNLQQGTGTLYTISSSVGISIYPHDSRDIDVLLKYADIAMYASKAKGKSTFMFYSDCAQVSEDVLNLEATLRSCISKLQGFELHYQPIVNLQTGVVDRCEALVRWKLNDKPISPQVFINAAEKMGVMNQLGFHILDMVFAQLKHWNTHMDPALQIAVNVSVQQFKYDFFERLLGLISKHGINPQNLTFEVTETIFLEDRFKEIIQSIRGIGSRISIDDFGTGYSSLSYLKKFPVDVIKIDKFFVSDPNSVEGTALVEAILALSKVFNYVVVAEGIETIEQETFVKNHGCNFGQGYLYSKPLPPKEFEEYYLNYKGA